jgi:hypothetical protein
VHAWINVAGNTQGAVFSARRCTCYPRRLVPPGSHTRPSRFTHSSLPVTSRNARSTTPTNPKPNTQPANDRAPPRYASSHTSHR